MKLTDIIKEHFEAPGAHESTSAATAERIVRRDANGRARVGAPDHADDIARKGDVDAVQESLDTHANNDANPHGLLLGEAAPALTSDSTAIGNLTFSDPVTQAEGEALRDETQKVAADVASLRTAMIAAGIIDE